MIRLLAITTALLCFACNGENPLRDKPTGTSGSYLTVLPDSRCIYARQSTLRAVTPDGELSWKWRLKDGPVIAAPAGAPDSTIFVRTGKALHAFSNRGKPLWTHPGVACPSGVTPDILAPVTMADSSVAVVTAYDEVRSFNPDGSKRWSADIPEGRIVSPLMPIPNGNLVVLTTAGAVAISPNGGLNWTKTLAELQQ
jgi:hypothetical protein